MLNQELLNQYQQKRNKLEQERLEKSREINDLREQISILMRVYSQAPPANYAWDVLAPLSIKLFEVEDAYKKIQS